MTVSPNTQAILLLTVRFAKGADSSSVKPLAPKEWGRFAAWLNQQSLTPEHLLQGSMNNVLQGWQDKTITAERVHALLDRGPALALSMEKWLRSGLWVMTRSDPDYPRRLKSRLRGDSPAVLFGCGHRALLSGGGLAVVGSRNAVDTDLAYSRRLGVLASESGISIVSGGARGVDESAMLGALETEGTAVGVLADSLLRTCTTAKYRRYLLDKSLALVSPFNPEAGFNAGNAMQRNKYVYCLADAAIVVHSGKEGGTWYGALEDLKKGWVPLWVKHTDDPEAGNEHLITRGAREASARIDAIDVIALINTGETGVEQAADLFEQTSEALGEAQDLAQAEQTSYPDNGAMAESTQKHISEPAHHGAMRDSTTEHSPQEPTRLLEISLYELFVAKAKDLCAHESRTADELVEALEINKTQLSIWLKQAVEEGELKKLAKPVRYEIVKGKQGVLAL